MLGEVKGCSNITAAFSFAFIAFHNVAPRLILSAGGDDPVLGAM
jgi:hypothetical protein